MADLDITNPMGINTSISKVYLKLLLFINISAQSFSDPDFLPWLNSALEQSQLPANSLIFQFREIDAVRYLKQAAAICEQMKKS